MQFARAAVALAGLALLLAGCATTPEHGNSVSRDGPLLMQFSAAVPGQPLPADWEPWSLAAFKRPTQYNLVDYDGRTVLEARSDGAASGLIHAVRFDPKAFPVLTWRWKVTGLISKADNTRARSEDSPVRIVVAFEGDRKKLKPMDQLVFTQFRMLAKTELPYATLMYIWENRAAPGTVIDSAHTSRIKMIVAASGEGDVGKWTERSVNLYEDYRRAFGEDPPAVKWIGVMTDTDNTGQAAHAYYGDIRVSTHAR
jgi:hypothetical protein